MAMPSVLCDLCGREIDLHASYVVRIDVYAEPSIPPTTADEIASIDLTETMDELLKQMEGMTAEELEESVHRRFEYRICPTCHPKFLGNPLGQPRVRRPAQN